MINRQDDREVVLQVAIIALVVGALFYYEYYFAVLVVVYVGLFADLYNRTSVGERLRGKLKKFFD